MKLLILFFISLTATADQSCLIWEHDGFVYVTRPIDRKAMKRGSTNIMSFRICPKLPEGRMYRSAWKIDLANRRVVIDPDKKAKIDANNVKMDQCKTDLNKAKDFLKRFNKDSSVWDGTNAMFKRLNKVQMGCHMEDL